MSRIHDALKRAEEQKITDLGPEKEPMFEDIAASAFPEIGLEIASAAQNPSMSSAPSMAVATSALDADILIQKCVKTVWSPTRDALFLVTQDSNSPGLEEFRTLRARLFQTRAKKPLKSVLISSALPSEGKSFVSANLAQAFARQRGGRTLLIDADLRKPRMHELLGAPSSPGLFEYLSGEAAEFDVVQKSNFDDLFFIPGGSVKSGASELIGNGRMKLLLDSMAPLFNWIVIDSSPVIPVSDPTRLAELCDGVLLVVKAGSTPYIMAERAKREFHDSRLLGVVLNQVPSKENPYYKYSYVGYGKSGI